MLKNMNVQQATKNIEQYATSPYNQRNRILSASNKPVLPKQVSLSDVLRDIGIKIMMKSPSIGKESFDQNQAVTEEVKQKSFSPKQDIALYEKFLSP